MVRSISSSSWIVLKGDGRFSPTPREVFRDAASKLRLTAAKNTANCSRESLCAALDLGVTPIVILDGRGRAAFSNASFRSFAAKESSQETLNLKASRLHSGDCSADVQAWLDTKRFAPQQDLVVFVQPTKVGSTLMTAFSVVDFGREGPRSEECGFLHNLLNNAATIQVLIDLLEEASSEQTRAEYLNLLHMSLKQLRFKINHERVLLDYSGAQLTVTEFQQVFEALVQHYRSSPNAKDCRIEILDNVSSPESKCLIDASVIRALDRIVSTVMDVIHEGDVITLSCRRVGGEVEFRIHCPNELSPDLHEKLNRTLSVVQGISTDENRQLHFFDQTSVPEISLAHPNHGTTMSVRCRSVVETSAYPA